jgi:hypothetical protein
VFPPPGHDVLVVPRPDRAVSHDFAGVLHPSPGVSPGCSPLFLRRRTRGLVASRCRSWGSTRFLRWGGGAGPEGLAIADDVSYRSHAFTLPRVDFTPLGGFPPLAAFRCFHRQTTFPSSSKRVTALLASVDFHVSVRSFEALLRERVRTERASLRMFAGLPSLGLVPLRGHIVGSCVPMGFVGTRCLRCPHPCHRSVRWGVRSCCSAESRSVPSSEPLHSRSESPRDARVFLAGVPHPTDEAAWGRSLRPRGHRCFRCRLGRRGTSPGSIIADGPVRLLLVWCPCGHHRSHEPRSS